MFGGDHTWDRQVQPLLNDVIRRQLLDTLSKGIIESMKKSPFSNTTKNITEMYNINEDKYYHEVDEFFITSDLSKSSDDSDSKSTIKSFIVELLFCEYAPYIFRYLRSLHNINSEIFQDELSNVSTLLFLFYG